MAPEVWKIKKTKFENSDTVTVVLESPKKNLKAQPGQFSMIYVPGVGEAAISYSDWNKKEAIHTIRAVGSVTKKIAKLKPKSFLGIRGPFGRGWPIDEISGKHVVVVAGGIGLAPLRPVMLEIIKQKKIKCDLFYGARSPSDRIFDSDLRKWRKLKGLRVFQTVDRFEKGWKDHVGVVTSLLDKKITDPSKTIAFICGPEVMMRFSARKLVDLGVDKNNIYLSMERNMKCAMGFCGHCLFGSKFICKDGPVFSFAEIESLLTVREV